jgi:glycerol-3-phosphate acyltransferase PlsY
MPLLLFMETCMVSFYLMLIAAYLIGAIPTGILLTRLSGAADIRKSGSGNIGATNVYRVAGKKLGILTLVGDALKGAIPVLAAMQLPGLAPAHIGAVAVAAFLGHCYPVYLGFKGGKGVATALGIFLVLCPLAVLGAFAIFAVLLWKWRYVSLGSIAAAAAIPLLVYFIDGRLAMVATTLFISLIVIWRHRQNITRLLNGSENRFKA